MKPFEIPSGPIRLELRYSLRTMPVGNEVITTCEVEASDERRQFRVTGVGPTWEVAEKDLVDGADFAKMMQLLRERHT